MHTSLLAILSYSTQYKLFKFSRTKGWEGRRHERYVTHFFDQKEKQHKR